MSIEEFRDNSMEQQYSFDNRANSIDKEVMIHVSTPESEQKKYPNIVKKQSNKEKYLA